MNTRWYLLRGNKPKADPTGPMSAEKLLELASEGGTAAGDWVWPAGVDVQIPVERFVAMMRSGKLPEWLHDVAKAEAVRQSTLSAAPDWLDDVAKSEPPRVSTEDGVPDWLDEMSRLENVPGNPAEFSPDWLEDIRQIEEALRLQPVAPSPPEIRPTKGEDIQRTKVAPPIAAPVAPQNLIAEPPPPFPPSPPLAAPLGFDPITGQIIDPAAYKNWQKAETQRRQEELQNQPTLSVAEVFLEAHRALQEWVDAEHQQAPGRRWRVGADPELSLSPGHPQSL